MWNCTTSLHTIGSCFAAHCVQLNTVLLPDTVTNTGDMFLHGCSKVQMSTHSSGAGCEVWPPLCTIDGKQMAIPQDVNTSHDGSNISEE